MNCTKKYIIGAFLFLICVLVFQFFNNGKNIIEGNRGRRCCGGGGGAGGGGPGGGLPGGGEVGGGYYGNNNNYSGIFYYNK